MGGTSPHTWETPRPIDCDLSLGLADFGNPSWETPRPIDCDFPLGLADFGNPSWETPRPIGCDLSLQRFILPCAGNNVFDKLLATSFYEAVAFAAIYFTPPHLIPCPLNHPFGLLNLPLNQAG